jgi:archaellum component FlaC
MSTMSGMEAKTETPGALTEFDRELERLESSISDLSIVVEPVTNRYSAKLDASNSTPREEPQTSLHGRIERLRDLTTALNDIRLQILL